MSKELAIITNFVPPAEPGEIGHVAIYNHENNIVMDFDRLSLVMTYDLAVDIAKALQREILRLATQLN